jgi:hypothetical protein
MGQQDSREGGRTWRFEALASGLVAMLALVISAYTVMGEIIGVGDEYLLFTADSARTAAAIISAADDTSMAFCYCSVLDDCWLLDLPPGASSPVTRPVERCPPYDTKFVGARIEDSQKWAERILDGREAGGGDAAADLRDAR